MSRKPRSGVGSKRSQIRGQKPPKPNAVYAGLARRALAFGYDYILIAIYIGVLAGLGLLLSTRSGLVESFFGNALSSDISAFVLVILPVIVYFGWQEGSSRASTWGKRRTGLRVTGADGRPIGYGKAFVRSALKFLPWQFGHTAVFQSVYAGESSPWWIFVFYAAAYGLGIVYLLAIWRRPDHRALYDVVAGTAVIVPTELGKPELEKPLKG